MEGYTLLQVELSYLHQCFAVTTAEAFFTASILRDLHP